MRSVSWTEALGQLALAEMPVTFDELDELRASYHCDDLELTDEMMGWTREEAVTFFESGGLQCPRTTIEDGLMVSLPSELGVVAKRVARPSGESTTSIDSLSSRSSSSASPSVTASPLSTDGKAHAFCDPADSITLPPAWVTMRACQEALTLASCASPNQSLHLVHALEQQGDVLFAHQRFDEASVAYHAAIKIAPDQPHLLHASKLTDEAVKGGVWFRQIVPGRDVALTPVNPEEHLIFGAAASMKNLMYLVGDATTRECYAVDACWDPHGIVEFAARHRMRLVGSICTHGHFDHAGGTIPSSLVAMVYGPMAKHKFDGHRVPGLREMGRQHGLKLYAHAFELGLISDQCGLEIDEIVPLHQGSTLGLGGGPGGGGAAGGAASGVAGGVRLEVLHTPGHSSGSICVCVQEEGRTSLVLVGDTVFPGQCGRLDLPDSDKSDMYDSFARLRTLDDSVLVYPGHSFSGKRTTIGQEKQSGLLRDFSKEAWLQMHAGTTTNNMSSEQSRSSPFAFVPPDSLG